MPDIVICEPIRTPVGRYGGAFASGISLGHPVGATAGRILATLAHELRRREALYGLETMCIGGGARAWPRSSSGSPDVPVGV